MRLLEPGFDEKQILIIDFHGDPGIQKLSETIKTEFFFCPVAIVTKG